MTYDGTARGSAAVTKKSARPGIEVRASNHAVGTASTRQPMIAPITRVRLVIVVSRVRSRHSAATIDSPPASSVRTSKYSSGIEVTTTATTAAPIRSGGGRCPRVLSERSAGLLRQPDILQHLQGSR